MNDTKSFIFKNYAFDPVTGRLTLVYAFDAGPVFEEHILFPVPKEGLRTLSPQAAVALDRIFRLLLLFAGVSYYKAAIPRRLVCPAFPLDAQTADFCHRVYEGGLGEFSYRNDVDLEMTFECDGQAGASPVSAPSLSLAARALVPVGGGKDSIVTIESLRETDTSLSLFALGGAGELAEPIKQTIAVSGLECVHVRRILSPVLLELNTQPNTLNGHVPITAILSCIALACAILYDFNAVVLSNERSASAPNLVRNGKEINHQYSKSFAFERDLAQYVQRYIAADLRYFSLLRPLSETAIAQRFSKCEAYHTVFRSCNAFFRQDETRRATHWCCACPKCRFVFLALAPFMEKDKLVAVFGANLLDIESQRDGYAELCGLAAFKPFECVGEIEESACLLASLSVHPAWRTDRVVAALAPDILRAYPKALSAFEALCTPSSEHLVPDEYLHALV